jgi:hypothetical protein
MRYNVHGRPSLEDLQTGDFLYSDIDCALQDSQVHVIESIDRISDVDKGAERMIFVINTRGATFIDAFSEGSYEFRTENILTVDDVVPSPIFKRGLFSNEASDTTTIPLLDLVR